MRTAYPKLFEPINIGKVTIKNRIAMAPMGIVGLTDQDGNPTQRAIDYYIERARGGVGLIITSLFKVENEIEVSEAIVAKENPDVVIIAMGSKPVIPALPGIEKANVFTCIDLLLGKKKAGKTIVVIGGGLVGCETALWLTQQGKEVTIVEMLSKLMTKDPEVPHMNRAMLLDLLAVNKVNIVTGASVQGITEEGAVVFGKALGRKVIKADTIILALGLKTNDELYKALAGKVTNLYALGDCQDPRDIMGAVWDGYEVGRTV
jgi:2-enoate reductase